MDYQQELTKTVLSYFDDKVIDDLFKYKKMSTDICRYVPFLPKMNVEVEQAIELLRQLHTYEEVSGACIKDRGWYANLKLKAEQTWLNALKGYFDTLANDVNEYLSGLKKWPESKSALRTYVKRYLDL